MHGLKVSHYVARYLKKFFAFLVRRKAVSKLKSELGNYRFHSDSTNADCSQSNKFRTIGKPSCAFCEIIGCSTWVSVGSTSVAAVSTSAVGTSLSVVEAGVCLWTTECIRFATCDGKYCPHLSHVLLCRSAMDNDRQYRSNGISRKCIEMFGCG